VRPVVDLVARATADLPAGHVLAMGGHHHAIADCAPQLIPAAQLAAEYPAPFYLIANRTLCRSVPAGEPIRLADVVLGDAPLLRLRREQDALFDSEGIAL
jgi:predicted homoserine dehydrogenase-like protein